MANQFKDKFLARFDRIDRKQLKVYLEELISENKFFETAINNIEEGILILDKNAVIRIVNKQAEYLVGTPSHKLKGKRIDNTPIDPQIVKTIEKIINVKKQYLHRKLLVTFPQEQVLKILVVPVEDSNSFIGWIIELQNVTDSEEQSSKKVRTEKLKALVTLAAGIAHELGNPLNSLGIHLQLIDKEFRKLPKKNKNKLVKPLEIVRTEVKRLDQIISQFLQATRPLKPKFLVSHIHELLDDTLALLDPEIKKHKIRITKKYYTKIPKIYLDYIQMRHAFMNIIKNSVEAMPKGGLLKINTALEDNKIKIAFKDNGLGISEDKLDKIFEPYYTTKVSGSGLGLMTVHRVVKEHNGEIELRSQIKKGTTVTVYLPIESPGMKFLPTGQKE